MMAIPLGQGIRVANTSPATEARYVHHTRPSSRACAYCSANGQLAPVFSRLKPAFRPLARMRLHVLVSERSSRAWAYLSQNP